MIPGKYYAHSSAVFGFRSRMFAFSMTKDWLYHDMSLVMRKLAFCICENKDADQLCDNHEADQRFVFATRIVQSLYFIYPKFQSSSRRVRLYSPICV